MKGIQFALIGGKYLGDDVYLPEVLVEGSLNKCVKAYLEKHYEPEWNHFKIVKKDDVYYHTEAYEWS